MNEQKLNEIKDTLETILASIPNEISVYDIEQKLDRLIELLEKQVELSDNIDKNLDHIEQNLPEKTSVDISTIENKLDSIWNMLGELNTNLDEIRYNTNK